MTQWTTRKTILVSAHITLVQRGAAFDGLKRGS